MNAIRVSSSLDQENIGSDLSKGYQQITLVGRELNSWQIAASSGARTCKPLISSQVLYHGFLY